MGDFVSALVDIFTAGSLYRQTLIFAVFLAFIATGEWVAERAGTLNISVEGMSLLGAFYAVVISDQTGSLYLGLVAGVASGMLVAFLHGELSHRLTADQFGVGLTLNLLVIGFTSYLLTKQAIFGSAAAELPGFDNLRWTALLIIPVVALSWWLVYRTRWGLEVRAAGENPQAADVSKVHVNRRRRQALLYCGAVCGLAGAYLSLAPTGFNAGLTGGRGIIAIAAVIFGGWTLRGALAGCALFGLVEALTYEVQGQGYRVNLNLLNSLPFAVTLLVMAFFARRTRAPKALAQPFVRGLN